MTWMHKYYTPEQLAALQKRWSPEIQKQAEADWAALYRDAEAARHEDPAGPKGEALAARYRGLIDAFTGGDPAIEASLKKLYADEGNWPSSFLRPGSPNANAFLKQAIAAHPRK